MKCPDGKACRRGDSFLRHDLENPFQMCGGKTCCLDCSRAKESCYPCDRMCSKAQALRKEKRDEVKAAEEKRAQEWTRKYQEETAANARRVLRAIEAAGLPDETTIPWDYYIDRTVGEIRKYAAGEFQDGMRWTEAKLSPGRLTNPTKTAKLLCCSTDYLLGLTDELTPASAVPQEPEDVIPAEVVEALLEEHTASAQEIRPVWLPGVPEKSCSVVARFKLSNSSGISTNLVELCKYDADDGEYCFHGICARIDAECTGWWPVPEKEESHADDQ